MAGPAPAGRREVLNPSSAPVPQQAVRRSVLVQPAIQDPGQSHASSNPQAVSYVIPTPKAPLKQPEWLWPAIGLAIPNAWTMITLAIGKGDAALVALDMAINGAIIGFQMWRKR